MCQSGIMKQILDGVTALELAWTISNYPMAGSIIVRTSRESVLRGVLIVKGPTRSTHTMTQGSDSAVLGDKRPYFLRYYWLIDRLDRWNRNVQHPVLGKAMSTYI
jgi:hypothetical protein